MKAVFFQFNNPFSKPLVIDIIDKLELDEVYNFWPLPICYNGLKPKNPSVKVHECYEWQLDVFSGKEQIIRPSDLIPLDEEILHKMSPYEDEAKVIIGRYTRNYPYFTRVRYNNMWLNRLDSWLCHIGSLYSSDVMPVTVRDQIYLKIVRFWNDFFSKNKIDVIISEFTTHGAFDYIGHRVAGLHGIPTVAAYGTHVTLYSFFFDDYKKADPSIVDVFNRLKSTVSPDALAFTPQYEHEFKRLTAKTEDQKIPWIGDLSSLNALQEQLSANEEEANSVGHNLEKKLIRQDVFSLKSRLISIAKKAISFDKRVEKYAFSNTINAYYESKCTKVSLDEKYIYLALHFQPELTTIPLGGRYGNQLLIAQALDYYLPEGYYIYIKEHPATSDQNYRSKAFYDELCKLKKVRLVSKSMNTFKLMEHCVATATITGTVGWEGVFKNKPCLLFGYHLFQYCPGVFPIRSNTDCKNAIDRIVQGVDISIDDLRYFIKAIETVTVNTASERFSYIQKTMSEDEWRTQLSDAYVKKVQEALTIH